MNIKKFFAKKEAPMAVKPFTPADAEARAKAGSRFPDVVIASFNEVIAKHYVNGKATFTLQEVVDTIIENWCDEHYKIIDANLLFANKWLDVEPVYRAQGWLVVFDKPGFNETYPATFTFTRPVDFGADR